ncbi:MAG: hypothetical protein R3222_10970, partial [Balneolaceae bacterium]|nr:hypothetical protein [Balneolaceae bacterium]
AYQEYNLAIKEVVANNSRLYLLDLATLMERVFNGEVSYDGVYYTLEFGSQSIISADGYTLNPKGQALLANKLIKLLNSTFDSSIPLIDVNSLPGTVFRNGF